MRHISLMLTGALATDKSNIMRLLMGRGFVRLPGMTTRLKRKEEIEGVDFFYLSKEEFFKKFRQGECCDPNLNATKYDNEYYGSPLSWMNFSPRTSFIFSPTATVTANLIKKTKKYGVLWVHLYTDEKEREYSRMGQKESRKICEKADININTANNKDTVTEIMIAYEQIERYRNGYPGIFLSRIDALKKKLPNNKVIKTSVPGAFTPIIADNVDDLVLSGLRYILQNGEHIDVGAGHGWQAYNAQYILTDPMKRLHSLRFPESLTYFKAELLAYFLGSQNINDGLVKASRFWKSICTSHSRINSNYGYYVFHETVPGIDSAGISQYEWCLQLLKENIQSRKALININSSGHKIKTRDFPCTISIQFYTVPHPNNTDRILHVDVKSRSTDIITGLPYDMGFFALLAEMMAKHLTQSRGVVHIGHVSMSATFTQLYESGLPHAEYLLSDNSKDREGEDKVLMPEIISAEKLLNDIYRREATTDLMKWIKQK